MPSVSPPAKKNTADITTEQREHRDMQRISLVLFSLAVAVAVPAADTPIDREALVSRHNRLSGRWTTMRRSPSATAALRSPPTSPGLQTFPDQYYRNGIPVEDARPLVLGERPQSQRLHARQRVEEFHPGRRSRRTLPHAWQSSPAGDWLRKNPRLQPLGQLSLDYTKPDGSTFTPQDVQEPEQTLDLWRGIITSRFKAWRRAGGRDHRLRARLGQPGGADRIGTGGGRPAGRPPRAPTRLRRIRQAHAAVGLEPARVATLPA